MVFLCSSMWDIFDSWEAFSNVSDSPISLVGFFIWFFHVALLVEELNVMLYLSSEFLIW